MFTLSEVECLGACVNAPMMQVNDDFYVSSSKGCFFVPVALLCWVHLAEEVVVRVRKYLFVIGRPESERC